MILPGTLLLRTTAICGVLALTQPVFAAEQPPAPAPAAEDDMGEIVVTGAILSAQQESIGLKRDAVNLTDIRLRRPLL